MDKYGQIADKIKEIAGTKYTRPVVFTAQVVKIEESLCSVKIGELELTGVRLRSVVNSNEEQLYIKPKEGSYVLLADVSLGQLSDLAVIGYSEIEAVNITIGETQVDIDKEKVAFQTGDSSFCADHSKIVFNGGNRGLVKVEELTARINELEKLFKQLQTDLSSWNAVPNDGGSALKALLQGGFLSQTVPASKRSEFENEKIVH